MMAAARLHTWITCILLAALSASVEPPAARADIVALEGRPMTVGVTIVAIENGRLRYQLSSGREVEQPVEQVKFLRITGADAFNEAEKLMQAGSYRAAAAAYEKILETTATSGPADGPDLVLLIRCRLVRAYDLDGRFDRSVAVYLDLVERMPAVLETLRPTHVPAAGSTFLPAAADAIEACISHHRGTPLGVSLARWRASWPDAGSTATRPAASEEDNLRKELTTIETLIAAGRFDEALIRLRPLDGPQAGPARAEVFYWLGRARQGESEKPDAADGVRDGERAGLAFMRVVIHFPGHPLAAECLFRAGQLCNRAGQGGQAAGLWNELLRAYPNAGPWAQQAKNALSNLQAGSTKPAAAR